jgi:two-component system, OmpR family, KDP operon response regulator KdpE
MGYAEILVIDDEMAIRKLLEITLQSNGYTVSHASSGKEGLIKAASLSPDLIILDLGLPDESGHDTLKKMREWSVKPIIILSVQSSEKDIIAALDHGANDYLVKPFRTGELLARIRSALRGVALDQGKPVISFSDFEIDLSARAVKKNDEMLKLTATQYSLLALFGKNEGKVLTHQYLLREVWGADHIDQLQYLRVFVAQLRKKIEKDPNRPEHIVTESGIGYRFIAGQP